MKQNRQAKILEIIENSDIETQDELLVKLAEAGYKATQATVSRDIREMKLTKVAGSSGRQKYALEKNKNHESMESYRQVLSSGILSVEAAENIIVIKTVSGVAMAVAAALDNMEINGLMGSIAGDDTIFLAVRSKELTMSVKSAIEKIV
jgi:transcriptional regulator of arginine metabolism